MIITLNFEKLNKSYLESELGGEGELVALEQPSSGVYEHGEGDAVDEVEHACLDLLGRLGAVYGLVEHHAERLQHSEKYSFSLVRTKH